ncbi:TetR family transcriptional regulator [Elioraea rosea]|uniref:TetR family transcriptional regulator n=1 Tax=Elioraea rosea TaxID=2492390 RepID=UPI001183A781|nr:TetR family transcriptional regulator [Elioraea rosea]
MTGLADSILDAALARANRDGWDAVRLHDVAAELGIPLTSLHATFRDADALADAAFDRLLRAMLASPEDPAGFASLAPRARTEEVMWRWFAAAAPHRRAITGMLAVKAWPSHPHTWVPMVFNLSRLIHWVREAALLDRGGVARMVEEVALTAAFLATLAAFAVDGTEGSARTRRTLEASLRGVPLR